MGQRHALPNPEKGHRNGEITHPRQNHAFFMAEGFRRLCAAKGNDPWRTFLRYQAQAERNYRRALEEFERL